MKFIFLISILMFATIVGAFPYDKYEDDSLLDLITSVESDAKSKNIPLSKFNLYIPAVRKKSVVEYTGKDRRVTKPHKSFLKDLIKSMPFIPQEQINLYTKEIKIKIEGREVWALIQWSVFSHLEKELKPGDSFEIYYFWLGFNEKDHIIAINEFISNNEQK